MPSTVKNSATAEKIVLVAGKLFAHRGYHGTSTREIAHQAGVSENTLFRHFDVKEDLFWSALRQHATGLRLQPELRKAIEQCDPPENILPAIFKLLADALQASPELPRLIAVAFLELPEKSGSFCQEHFSAVLSAVTQYLSLNIQRGRIRDLDPILLTAAFTTSALMHSGLSRLLGKDSLSQSHSREQADACARFWLEALAPPSGPFMRSTKTALEESPRNAIEIKP
jgi:AcrR family transcriptional regulator